MRMIDAGDRPLVKDDLFGIAATDETAIEAARKVIDELLAERGPEDPNPTIVVKNKQTRSFIGSLAIEI